MHTEEKETKTEKNRTPSSVQGLMTQPTSMGLAKQSGSQTFPAWLDSAIINTTITFD